MNSGTSSEKTVSTYFQNNKFEGAKDSFQRFKDELTTEVTKQLGARGREFLFTVWPNNIPNISKFEIRDAPDSLDGLHQVQNTLANGTAEVDANGAPVMIPVTAEMRKERREERKAVNEFNKEIEELETTCFKIISERCNDALNIHFMSLGGDPIAVWAYLCENYGPASRGPQEEGGAFIKFIEIEMKYDERFSNFMVNFEREMTYTGTSKNAALGLLQSDGSSGKGIQVLPDRLMVSVNRSKEMRHDYDQFIPFMIQQDDIQHQKGHLEANKKRSKVSAVRVNADKPIEADNPPVTLTSQLRLTTHQSSVLIVITTATL
jgi:hypothetical protein